MSRILSTLIASTLFLTALTPPCFAQFGGGGRGGGGFGGGRRGAFAAGEPWAGGVLFGDAQNPSYTRMVVLSNAGTLSDTVRGIVAAELVHRLVNSEANDDVQHLRAISLGQPMGVPFTGPDDLKLGDDSIIQALTISFRMPSGDDGEARELNEQDEARFAKLWEQSRQQLEKALRSAQRRIVDQKTREHQRQLRTVESQSSATQQALEQVIHEIEARQQEGSSEQLRAHLESASETLREMAVDRVSVDARREAIVARVDELRKASEEASTDDPLIAELQKIVDIRERQLQGVRDLRTAGTVPASELNDAETEMANARVELLKAKQAAIAEAAGGAMQELNNELSRLIVQLAEFDARSDALEATVKRLREATSVSETTTAAALNHQLTMLRRQLAELQETKSRLENSHEPPAELITITPLDKALSLGGEDGAGGDDAPQNE